MISVVIPIYNRSKVLKRCLQSFERQCFRPLELILVDNNSTDDSWQICQDFCQAQHSEHFQVKILQEKGPGACAARNTGLHAASGQFVSFFDSDDEVYPEMYSHLSALINAHPQALLIAMRAHLETSPSQTRMHPKRMGVDAAQHLIDPLLVTHNFLVRRDFLLQHPDLLWNEQLARWQDYDFAFRLLHYLREEEIVWTNKPLYLIHSSNDAISSKTYSHDGRALAQALQSIEDFISDQHRLGSLGKQDLERLRTALAFKKISLACLIHREHLLPPQELAAWIDYACEARRSAKKTYRPLLSLHEAYSKRGGRAFWRIFSLFMS